MNTGAFIVEHKQASRGKTRDESTINPMAASMLWEFASWRRAGGQRRGCKWWEQGHRWATCSLFAAFTSKCEHVTRTFCQILRTPVLATHPGMQPTALSHANTQTRSHANTQTRRHANTQTRKHADTQTRKHADTQTRKHADTQTRKGRL